jgi:hypothetical protein
VQSHVHELTERDDYVTTHQFGEAEPAGHYNVLADENANAMQEVYGIVDADVKRFIPPPTVIKTIHGASEEGDSTPKVPNIERLPMDIKFRMFVLSCRKRSLHGRREPTGWSGEHA